MKEFSHRFDLANGKYFSILLGVFARIVKVTHYKYKVTNISIEHYVRMLLDNNKKQKKQKMKNKRSLKDCIE